MNEKKKEYMKLYMRRKRLENPDKYAKKNSSKERTQEEKRRYYKSYVEKNGRYKLNFSGNLSRAKKRGHSHSFTYEDWLQKLLDTNGFCPICGADVGIDKLSMDHIIPTTRAPVGTVYSINDVRPLCCECNRIKWTNSDEELLVRLKKFVFFLENKRNQ